MAQINIITTDAEQKQVKEAIRQLVGQTVSIVDISKKADMNPNRVRYVVTDLVDTGQIRRIPTRVFNKHFIRYSYEVV